MTAAICAPERATNPAATPSPASPPAAAPRHDMYVGIHKALRSFMMDTLLRVGRLDVTDEEEAARVLGQVDDLLGFCLGHIEHENDFVHRAIDARLPHGAARTAGDHVEHVQTLEALRAENAALRRAAPDERATLALRLYRHLALFVAENFQHMHIEETANNAALWAHYDDAELDAIHQHLLASITPQEQLVVLRWMVPAFNPTERAMLLGGVKRQAPPEAFLGVLQSVRPHLDDVAWGKLARAVGVPAQLIPG